MVIVVPPTFVPRPVSATVASDTSSRHGRSAGDALGLDNGAHTVDAY